MPNRRISRAHRIKNRLNGRSLVFLGMMGSGKSAIGKMVARSLGLEFRDSDTEIETAAGRSVPEIFDEYGEKEFRRLEQRVILRVMSDGPILLALGGGAFLAEETRQGIEQNGLSVWLNVPVDIILERVSRRPKKRPLLRNGNPREIVETLLAQREPIYSLAEVHVLSDGGTKSEMRDLVLERIDQHLENEL